MTRKIKTILVSLNNTGCFDSNMSMARQIAAEYGSHIIGLYVIPSAIVYSAPYGFGSPINVTDLNRFYRSKAATIEDKFHDFIKSEGLKGEWRLINSSGHFISDSIIDNGREADLVLLGDESNVKSDMDFEGRIVQALGRPVLIVPSYIQKARPFKKAIIGWDGSREAARAAFDAIPLLKMADKAEVTVLNAHKEREISGDMPGTELATSLARYDVKAEAVYSKSRRSVAKTLVETAKSGDLLVMGAYGHSRLREDIFGGATHKALSDLPCPILMSN